MPEEGELLELQPEGPEVVDNEVNVEQPEQVQELVDDGDQQPIEVDRTETEEPEGFEPGEIQADE